MKHLFPGLAIICATALFIAGSTWPGIIFASLGFLGAMFGAAIRYQSEQEATKAAKELTEAIAASGAGKEQVEQLGEAFGQLMTALMSGFTDPSQGGNHGGNNNIH